MADMTTFLLVFLPALTGVIVALLAWRRADRFADRVERARLLIRPDPTPRTFDPAMLAELPEPARRYLSHAILPGAELRRGVSILRMTGRFDPGTREAPQAMEMVARQVIAVPAGFLWEARAGRGIMAISGSDSGSWTRFWLAGLVPVARAGGTADHRRSAFGRLACEAAIWTPAALLPGPGVRWEAAGPDAARVTLSHEDLVQSVTLSLAPDGRPLSVVTMRWSNANPAKRWQLQPFGADLSAEREVQGYRVPTHVEAGNFHGTDDYFPFFVADIGDLRFF